MTTIYYNGQDVFSNCIGTPLVTIDVSYNYINNNLSRLKTITLRGKIKKTNCDDGFTSLYIKQRELISKFSVNFKALNISENSIQKFYHASAIVKSINFDENTYANVTTFTIVFECYDYNYADNGILNPSDEIQITNNEDGTQSITRSMSCSSYTTSSHYMDNAISFLRNPSSSPLIPSSAILLSRAERINRHTGTGSVTYQYIYDPNNRQGVSNRGVLTYSISTSQNEDSVEVSVSGEVVGGMDCTMQNLRDSFNYINWYTLCSSEYNDNYVGGSLGEAAINFSVTENINENTISFNVAYDNVSQKDAYIIDTVTVVRDRVTGQSCVNVRLEFVCDYGCKQQRWSKVNALYTATSVEDFADDAAGDYLPGELISNTYKSRSVSFDEQNARIVATTSHCNDLVEDCGCLRNFEYSMQFTPSITKYTLSSTLEGEGCYYIQNLGFKNRARFTISGSYSKSPCCTLENAEKELLSRINFITSIYFPAEDKIIENRNIEYTEFGVVNFSFAFNGILDFSPPVESGALLESGEGIVTEAGEPVIPEG